MDATTRDVIPVVTDTATAVGGGVSAYAGFTLCGTVAGCVFGGPMFAFGVGNVEEGTTGFYNHFTNDEGGFNHVKQVFDQIPGGYGPLIYSGADLALSFGSGFVKVPLKMGLADGLNKSDSLFGVTVRGFDNNKIILGRPTPYGTAMGLYFQSVGLKSYVFYNEAVSEKK